MAERSGRQRKYRILSPNLHVGEAVLARAHEKPDGPYLEPGAAKWCLKVEVWFMTKAAMERWLDANKEAPDAE